MEKITVLNREKQKLSVVINRQKKKTNRIIIFAHSFKSDKDTDYIATSFDKHIYNEGYSFLRFDFWWSWESEWNFEESRIKTQIRDLEDIIEYVKTNGYTDICLAGLSLWTTSSLMAYNDSIKCMILWSPCFHLISRYEIYENEMKKNNCVIEKNQRTGKCYKIWKKMLKDFKRINPILIFPKIKCPILIVIWDEDKNISEKEVKRFMKMLRPENKLEVIKNWDHDFLNKKAKKEVISVSSGFIKKYL